MIIIHFHSFYNNHIMIYSVASKMLYPPSYTCSSNKSTLSIHDMDLLQLYASIAASHKKVVSHFSSFLCTIEFTFRNISVRESRFNGTVE